MGFTLDSLSFNFYIKSNNLQLADIIEDFLFSISDNN